MYVSLSCLFFVVVISSTFAYFQIGYVRLARLSNPSCFCCRNKVQEFLDGPAHQKPWTKIDETMFLVRGENTGSVLCRPNVSALSYQSWEFKSTPPMPPLPRNKVLSRDYYPPSSPSKALLRHLFLLSSFTWFQILSDHQLTMTGPFSQNLDVQKAKLLLDSEIC